MGFFSNDCHRCGHPLLSAGATSAVNAWMTDAVALKAGGSVLIGTYNGYGQIGDFEYAVDEATVYHRACWEVAGKPTTFQGESPASEDQGWFFDDGDHDLPDPRTTNPLREPGPAQT